MLGGPRRPRSGSIRAVRMATAPPGIAHAVSGAVQLCFGLHDAASDLNPADTAFIVRCAESLQSLLVQLQKAALHDGALADDAPLLGAVEAVSASLEGLQAAAAACRCRHWLLRVLKARDVRHHLAAGFKGAAAALQLLVDAADGKLEIFHQHELQQLRDSVACHKVTRHDPLESLARGLFKHMADERTEPQQLPSMLRFVVKQAASQTQRVPPTGSNGNGSTISGGGGGGSGHASTSASGGNQQVLPPGETSLSDPELLLQLEELAESKPGSEQVPLYQILSILEERHEAKRQQESHARRHGRRRHHQQQNQQSQQQHLQRVSEADDATDAFVIAAMPAQHDTAPLPDQGRTALGAASPIGAAAGARSEAVELGEPAGDGQHAYAEKVAAMMAQLEDMLWRDPWDAVVLTQLLELLMQVEDAGGAGTGDDSDQEEAEAAATAAERAHRAEEKQQREQAARDGRQPRKWWQMGASTRGVLQSRSGGQDVAAAGSRRPNRQALVQQHRQQRQEWRTRVHSVASGGLDVLLHLTPRPSSSTSFIKPASRDGVCTAAGHSLALPLMAHADTVPVLAGCLWSAWPEVSGKAAQLISILIDSGDDVAAADAAGAASGTSRARDTYAAFCRQVCGAGGGQRGERGSVWFGLVHLLHSASHPAAGAAAEALAAVGSSPALSELCTSLAATQQARALLLVLSRYQLHNGAGGAAAAALLALAEQSLRPAMHAILANSYFELVQGAADSLGALLVQAMVGGDALAAVRAAQLAAALAPSAPWAGRATLWAESFRAGLKLLSSRSSSRSRGAGASASSSASRAAGAWLLARLLGATAGAATGQQQEPPLPMIAACVEATLRDELLFEALQLSVQQFGLSGSWEGMGRRGGAAAANEGLAAVQCMHALLCWLPVEPGTMPELTARVLPVVEHLAAVEHGELRGAAIRVQERLLGLR